MSGKKRPGLSRSALSKSEGGLACYVNINVLCIEYISSYLDFFNIHLFASDFVHININSNGTEFANVQ